MLGLLDCTVLVYIMCFMSPILLLSICVQWYDRCKVGGTQRPTHVRHTGLEVSTTYWAVFSSLFELGNMIYDARSPIHPHIQLVKKVEEWVAQKHLPEE